MATAVPPLLDVSVAVLATVAVSAVALFSGMLVAREVSSGRRSGCGGRPSKAYMTRTSAAYGAIGAPATTRTWYDQENLRLAPWQPPAPVFAVVWWLLYGIMVAQITMLLHRVNDAGTSNLYYVLSVVAWLVLLVLNLAWTPLFYWAHRVYLALAVIVLSTGISVGQLPLLWYAAGGMGGDRLLLAVFGLSFAPALWLCYATSLNAYTTVATDWENVRDPTRVTTLIV